MPKRFAFCAPKTNPWSLRVLIRLAFYLFMDELYSLKIQQLKMKELWDNEDDEEWDAEAFNNIF